MEFLWNGNYNSVSFFLLYSLGDAMGLELHDVVPPHISYFTRPHSTLSLSSLGFHLGPGSEIPGLNFSGIPLGTIAYHFSLEASSVGIIF